jgi:hypothetical protein
LIGGRTYNRKEEKKKKTNRTCLEFSAAVGSGGSLESGDGRWCFLLFCMNNMKMVREKKESVSEKKREEREKNFTNDENLGKKKYIAIVNVRKRNN